MFKKSVTFTKADLDSGAIARDEALVKELATFLNDQAVTKLVRDLQAVEGVPTDSESLEQAFHSHGVNMRYIGAVAKVLAGKELAHLKTQLEREAFVRALKHIANEELREGSDTYLSATIAHLFNLVLAPFPLLEKLEQGSVSYPESARQASSEAPVAASEEEGKTEKKKNKKQKKKAVDEVSKPAAQATTELSEKTLR